MEGKNEPVMHLIIQSQTQEGNQSRKSQTKMQTQVRQRHWTTTEPRAIATLAMTTNFLVSWLISLEVKL